MSGANISENEINEPNRWRLETPGHSGWKRTARPNDPDKYLMISADCHCNEPSNLWVERIDRKFRDRLPRIEIDENGVKWAISEGWARSRLLDSRLEGEDHLRSKAGADPEQRLKDQIRDGVDAEIIFPNKGLSMWATPDADFAHAQCRIYNDWAWETFAKYNDRMSPLAAIATADLPGSIKEVERVAKLGFRGLTLPCKPIFGAHDARHPNYNLPIFDPACVGDPGSRSSDHVPCLDRTRSARGPQRWRRGHQLRFTFARPDHRAGRKSLRLRRARAFSGT